MYENRILEFKKYVVQSLISKYKMDELSAAKAVRNSYLSIALSNDPDYIMHDTVEEWADYIYEESAEDVLLQM